MDVGLLVQSQCSFDVALHGRSDVRCILSPRHQGLIFNRPEIFRMTEFNDNTELQTYSTAVLYVLSAFTPPAEYIPVILNNFVSAIMSATVGVLYSDDMVHC